jgi:hypothetical protein
MVSPKYVRVYKVLKSVKREEYGEEKRVSRSREGPIEGKGKGERRETKKDKKKKKDSKDSKERKKRKERKRIGGNKACH